MKVIHRPMALEIMLERIKKDIEAQMKLPHHELFGGKISFENGKITAEEISQKQAYVAQTVSRKLF